jgi:formylglycine-generating enzyme required for sulfatase activity/outer membrane protein OmpA-like peptidoglycan-associated protein
MGEIFFNISPIFQLNRTFTKKTHSMNTTLRSFISVVFGFMTILVTAQTSNVKMPDMILVKGGIFTMGSKLGMKDEAPEHKVTLADYSIGRYEVTFCEFKKFVDATGYITDAEQPDSVRMKNGQSSKNVYNGSWKMYMNGKALPLSDTVQPVGNISWYDAMAYCKWLSEQTGKKFSLPTEAEWEFAARGGIKSKGYTFSGGNNIDEVAWYNKNSYASSHRPGQKMENELGIYDMTGNMREWCSDWYGDTYYKTSPDASPMGPERGKHKVIRGGSWVIMDVRGLRVTYRNNELPHNSALDHGFRLAIPGEKFVPPPPPPPPAPKEETGLLKDLDAKGMIDIYGINFDIGKSTVKPESFPIIDQVVTYLKDHANVRIEIEGHTDNTGKAESNLTLSSKRAESIKAEIVQRGIDAGRLETKGFGASKPIADNKTAAGRTQNRRVTIKKL